MYIDQVHVYIYIYIHIRLHIYIYTHINICAHIHINFYGRIHMGGWFGVLGLPPLGALGSRNLCAAACPIECHLLLVGWLCLAGSHWGKGAAFFGTSLPTSFGVLVVTPRSP